MLANFDGDYDAAANAYCGLEARFTTPDGTQGTLYIIDGFDDAWVRTPASVDVPIETFAQFFGARTEDKNDVVKEVEWTLTGKRDERYSFKGSG